MVFVITAETFHSVNGNVHSRTFNFGLRYVHGIFENEKFAFQCFEPDVIQLFDFCKISQLLGRFVVIKPAVFEGKRAFKVKRIGNKGVSQEQRPAFDIR